MMDALHPWARALIDSGLLGSWSTTLELSEQWALAWADSEHRGKLPAVFSADSDELIRASSDAQIVDSEARHRLDLIKDPFEGVSGVWVSTPPVGLSLVEDDFGLERARACRLQIRAEARICEISRPEEWAALCRRYPIDVTAQRRQVWFETTGRKGRWVIPDWSQVAEEFDGIHVSLVGYLRTAGVVIPVGDHSIVADSEILPTTGNTGEETASLMAGWNPDTTYWLHDVTTGIAEVVDWVFAEDIDEWRRR